jgi:hypothetical protein
MHTLVDVYGLRRPTVLGDLVLETMKAASAYRNKLVEIERERRDALRGVLEEVDEQLAPIMKVAELASDAVLAAEKEIKKIRARTRRRADTAEQRKELRRLKEARKVAWDEVKVARAAARARDNREAIASARTEILARATEKVASARAASGLPWGTYQIVEAAMDQSRKAPLWKVDKRTGMRKTNDPRFRWWDGNGAVAVHIQNRILATEKALDGTDRWVRILIDPAPTGAVSRRQRSRRFGRVHLRLGTDASGLPIMAEWPILMHRPLPEDAQIVWATVHRRMVADRDRWELHLTMRVPEGEVHRRWPDGPRELNNVGVPRRGVGTLAVDVGWRKLPDGDVRVAYMVDDAGAEREVRLESERAGGGVLSGLRKVEDLQSIRSKLQNELVAALREWLASALLPEWLRESTAGLAQWRSPGRIARLRASWRGQRWEGDAVGWSLLDAWYHRDRHLWQWQEQQLNKSIRRRRDAYRVVAAELASRYNTLLIEAFDKRATQRHEPTESEKIENEHARWQQKAVATSILCKCLKQAFLGRGGRVVKMDPAMTTQRCAVCGCEDRWDAAGEVEHLCPACGRCWDQDANACRNMLAARERGDGDEILVEKPLAKWEKRGRHNGTARNVDCNMAPEQAN